MNFEIKPPSSEEERKLLKYFTEEEVEILKEQNKSDIKELEEKVYSSIKGTILRGSIENITEERKQFFLDHLKEEDFELAAKLNKR